MSSIYSSYISVMVGRAVQAPPQTGDTDGGFRVLWLIPFLGNLGATVAVQGQLFNQSLDAQEISTATLARLLTATRILTSDHIGSANINRETGKGISATAHGESSILKEIGKNINANTVGTAVLDRILSGFRTFAAQAIFSANQIKEAGKTIAASCIASPTLARLVTAFRNLNAQYVGESVLNTASNVAQLFLRTFAAAAVFTPNLNRRVDIFRTLAAQAIHSATALKNIGKSLAGACIGAGAILKEVGKTLSAGTIGQAILTRALTAFRTLAATTIGNAVLDAASTAAQLFLRTLSATAQLTPDLARRAELFRTLAARAILRPVLTTVSDVVAAVSAYLEQRLSDIKDLTQRTTQAIRRSGIDDVKDLAGRVPGVNDLGKRVTRAVDWAGRVVGIKGHKR